MSTPDFTDPTLHIAPTPLRTEAQRQADAVDLERLAATDAEAINGPAGPGWELLDEVEAFFNRFAVFPSAAASASVALWTAHTHALAAFDTTPRLNLTSAEKRSGKSRVLELMELLVARPAMAATMSAAAVFRQVDAVHPTLLMDEVDAIFSKGRDERNEELRGLLNAGQRRGVPAYRCTGPKMETVKAYDAFCAVALAGIGQLPSTIADRSVIVAMKRRAPGETVERFRRRKVKPAAGALRDRLAAWAEAHRDELAAAEPDLPDALDDRAADGWEPLFAVADAAGGEWPKRARQVAVELSAGRIAEDDTIGVRLLADVAAVFGDSDRLASADLAARLAGLEEAPWGDWYGRPLDARGLAKKLRPFEIRPCKVRLGDHTAQGYRRDQFADSWSRYGATPPLSAPGPEQPEHRRSEALFEPEQTPPLWGPKTPPDLRCSGVPDNPPVQAERGVTGSFVFDVLAGKPQHCGRPGCERFATMCDAAGPVCSTCRGGPA